MTRLHLMFRHGAAAALVLGLAACQDETTPLELNGPPAGISIASGNNQTGAAGAPLANPLVVTVTDANGRPAPAVQVNWSTTAGTLSSAIDSTDDDGRASVTWVVPGNPGQYQAVATVGGVGNVTFTANVTPPAGNLVFRYIDAGSYHTCGITTTEQLYCWGYNGDGQLGTPASVGTSFPTLVPDVERYRIVAGGRYHTCGITLSGDINCWGENKDARQDEPPPLTWQSMTAGYVHSCGITIARNLHCWGLDEEGQLGGGDVGPSYKAVTANGSHTCGIQDDGRAWCWGFNAESQLGTGLPDRKVLAPTPVSTAVVFRTDPIIAPHAPNPDFPLPPGPFIAAGFAHTCAIGEDGVTYCWGLNENGQVGDNTQAIRLVPTAVGTSLQFVRITAGHSHSCGLTANGAAYCWGDNTHGQLGDGTTSRRLIPVAVSGSLQFAYIKAGELSTCAVTFNGVAYCWGNNEYGQIGDGTKVNRAQPTKVAFQP